MTVPPPGQNRLALETSPYLLQHADNPVEWYPWGEEAFARAKGEDKPLLVSIGYSSCHWCHVMEHECFEDPAIAAVMNERFVCVKVDREERPDVDEIYMTAVQMMGLGGGWPLNVFLTPDGVPFYGGTYFPPRSQGGRIGWPDLLVRASDLWQTQREKVLEQGDSVLRALEANAAVAGADALPGEDLVARAAAQLATGFDSTRGGFGGAPKFPPHPALEFLLARAVRSGDPAELEMIEATLDAMDRGGIRDQLAGGFHRYSVDDRWLVPHFEKMLYDNAQLARVYVEAWQVTGNPRWAAVARSTLDWVLRDMTGAEGGFYSATDADSDGHEGTYFVWTRPELDALLGDGAPLFAELYGVTPAGNFRDPHNPTPPGAPGMNVLSRPVPFAAVAAAHGMTEAELEARLAPLRATLLAVRVERVPPMLDDKVIAAWNGLMIGALATAGRALDEPRYVDAAARAARFVLESMRDDDGRLLRTWREGTAKVPAQLRDVAFLGDACVDLWEATFDPAWIERARELADDANSRFAAEDGGWWHTPHDGEALVTRSISGTDGALPSENAVAARLMLRLAALGGEEAYREAVDGALRRFAPVMERIPGATLGLIRVLDDRLRDAGEVVVAGRPGAADTRALVRAVHSVYLPGVALALADPDDPGGAVSRIPLLAGKVPVGGAAALYVCRNWACEAPVTGLAAGEAALARFRTAPRTP